MANYLDRLAETMDLSDSFRHDDDTDYASGNTGDMTHAGSCMLRAVTTADRAVTATAERAFVYASGNSHQSSAPNLTTVTATRISQLPRGRGTRKIEPSTSATTASATSTSVAPRRQSSSTHFFAGRLSLTVPVAQPFFARRNVQPVLYAAGTTTAPDQDRSHPPGILDVGSAHRNGVAVPVMGEDITTESWIRRVLSNARRVDEDSNNLQISILAGTTVDSRENTGSHYQVTLDLKDMYRLGLVFSNMQQKHGSDAVMAALAGTRVSENRLAGTYVIDMPDAAFRNLAGLAALNRGRSNDLQLDGRAAPLALEAPAAAAARVWSDVDFSQDDAALDAAFDAACRRYVSMPAADRRRIAALVADASGASLVPRALPLVVMHQLGAGGPAAGHAPQPVFVAPQGGLCSLAVRLPQACAPQSLEIAGLRSLQGYVGRFSQFIPTLVNEDLMRSALQSLLEEQTRGGRSVSCSDAVLCLPDSTSVDAWRRAFASLSPSPAIIASGGPSSIPLPGHAVSVAGRVGDDGLLPISNSSERREWTNGELLCEFVIYPAARISMLAAASLSQNGNMRIFSTHYSFSAHIWKDNATIMVVVSVAELALRYFALHGRASRLEREESLGRATEVIGNVVDLVQGIAPFSTRYVSGFATATCGALRPAMRVINMAKGHLDQSPSLLDIVKLVNVAVFGAGLALGFTSPAFFGTLIAIAVADYACRAFKAYNESRPIEDNIFYQAAAFASFALAGE